MYINVIIFKTSVLLPQQISTSSHVTFHRGMPFYKILRYNVCSDPFTQVHTAARVSFLFKAFSLYMSLLNIQSKRFKKEK